MAKDIFVDEIKENTLNNGVIIEEIKHKQFLELPPILKPVAPLNNRVQIYSKADKFVYIQGEDGIERLLATSIGGSFADLYPAETNANYNNYRIRSLGSNGSFRFNFVVPANFTTLASLQLVGAPIGSAAGAGKDIDLFSNYANENESVIQHSESDTSILYDFTGNADQWVHIDISSVFSNLTALDKAGVFVNHMGIGGSINYIGVLIIYS